MMKDFLMDVLLLHQGRNVSETAIILHGIKLTEPSKIKDWHAFLLEHVEPGDYVLPNNARDIMINGLTRRLRMIEMFNSSKMCDFYNTELSRRYGPIFLAMMRHVKSEVPKYEDSFLREWINTGLYIGAQQAWELYIARLARCLDETSDARDFVCIKDVPEVGERIGKLVAEILSVNAFMLGCVPV